MVDNWTTTTLTASNSKNAWNRPEEQNTIFIIQGLLDGNIEPKIAAREIASTYHPRLLKGEKISYYPFTLLSLAIIQPATTFKNFEDIVQMLMHISKLPDVIFEGKPLKENYRTYWHDIPEFDFQFSQTALSVNTIENIDLGHCTVTWHQQAQQYLSASTFASLYLNALSPTLSPIEFNSLYIPAASAYLIHSAPLIWSFCKTKEKYQGERVWKQWIGGSDGGEPLWKGDDGFSVQRWGFWKERLGDLAGLKRRGFAGRVIDGIVMYARMARRAMDEVELEDGFALDGVSRLYQHGD
ncbi:hypothetical protein D6C86_07374 [Aureobasidium pullulans]|uniref:Uncharacterized protein n=1 Tax=Aureobasidium pullulans TaxID=5580 RepID=A0A4S9UDP8_AURPU|nr:hypothetical protein D6C94_05196 [Aureobasidium pullulans]THZ35538.1 hypothetical protein D6C87_09748 [Aureobasidium pullulans]THZ57068.1 hypothetical protein D6C86_07374 [Aureobasidium pullulans]